MTENINQKSNSPQTTQKSKKNKKSHPLLIIILIFAAFWTFVFITQKKDPIKWIEDYQTGVELATKENKPLLLVFYKINAPMYTAAAQDTYKNPKVKQYVENNFVPVLINVDKEPDIARLYNISYYPTLYVKEPNSDESFGPRLGYDPPDLFISEVQILLDKLKKSKNL
ncbi:MAG: DUF255 domain-containing protein [Phycisphaerae bacterium]